MGVQSYSMRKMGLEAMLQATRALGLDAIEAFMAHLPYFSPREQWDGLKRTVAQSGVVGAGVWRGELRRGRAGGAHHLRVREGDGHPRDYRRPCA
jgi:sugar phosphate isomerase/epimerase